MFILTSRDVKTPGILPDLANLGFVQKLENLACVINLWEALEDLEPYLS